MSQSKFASITASLLARKGEATPWEEPQKRLLSWASEIPHAVPDQPPITKSPQGEPVSASVSPSLRPSEQSIADCSKLAAPNSVKKCTVRVSYHDYERLGILAVKRGTTRHHLLQEAVMQFLTSAAQPYSKECLCLGPLDCASRASSLDNATA